jgi:diguanylate cyclase (GGDEF)-like protein
LLQARAQLLLSNAYQELGDYKAALSHYEAYSTLELDNRDTSNIKAMEALDLTKNEYEYELQLIKLANERNLKQSEFEKLTDQKRAYNFVVACLVLLLVLAIMAQRQTRNKARIDSLTCALNRTAIIETIKSQTSKTHQEMRYVLALIDLDNFKAINDQYGHQMGDRLLRVVAKRLVACVRTTDTVSRLSGDEFTIILQGLDRIQDIRQVAQKILDCLIAPIHLHGQNVPVQISIGIAVSPKDSTDPGCLLAIADQAMYRAKDFGGQRWYFATPEWNLE